MQKHFKEKLSNEFVKKDTIISIEINYMCISYLGIRLCIPIYNDKSLYFEHINDVDRKNYNKIILDLEKKINQYKNNIKECATKLEKINSNFILRILNHSNMQKVKEEIQYYGKEILMYKNKLLNSNKEMKKQKEIKENERSFLNFFKTEIKQFLDIGYCVSNKPRTNNTHTFFMNINEYFKNN